MPERVAKREAHSTSLEDCRAKVRANTGEWFVNAVIKTECALVKHRLDDAQKATEVCDHFRK